MQKNGMQQKPNRRSTKHIVGTVILPSEIKRSRISHAKIVGFSRLYCSILATTVGVATFGLLPPMIPGGLKDPIQKLVTTTYS